MFDDLTAKINLQNLATLHSRNKPRYSPEPELIELDEDDDLHLEMEDHREQLDRIAQDSED